MPPAVPFDPLCDPRRTKAELPENTAAYPCKARYLVTGARGIPNASAFLAGEQRSSTSGERFFADADERRRSADSERRPRLEEKPGSAGLYRMLAGPRQKIPLKIHLSDCDFGPR